MNPDVVAQVSASTALGVGIILAFAGGASAVGWGLIMGKYLDGIARQPEMRPQLLGQALFAGGLMEAFPFIVLGLSMWFIFANPFMATAAKALGG